MKTKPRELYIHKKTGEMIQATRAAAKKLGDDYTKVEFTTNKDGKPMARVKIEGATIDIVENDAPAEIIEGEVVENGNSSTN